MSYNQDIIFNGARASDFGIRVWAPPSISIPQKRVTEVELPGRNGMSILDEGFYMNVERKYKISIYNIDQNGNEIPYYLNYAKISAWLTSANGYLRLEDTYEPDVFRYAYIKNPVEVANLLNIVGTAEIVFSCKPQAYLKNIFPIEHVLIGEELQYDEYSLYIQNPYTYYSTPRITFETENSYLKAIRIACRHNNSLYGTLMPLSVGELEEGLMKEIVDSEEMTIKGEYVGDITRSLSSQYNVNSVYPILIGATYDPTTGLNPGNTRLDIQWFTGDDEKLQNGKITVEQNFWRL